MDYLMTKESRQETHLRGQHLVVLPKAIIDRAAKHAVLASLLPTDAGFFPQTKGHYVQRIKGSETSLVILCLKGRGWYQCDKHGERGIIEPGQVLVLPAGHPHAYGADAEEPWVIEWVHFTGSEANAWMDYLGAGSSENVLEMPAEDAPRMGLARVWEQLERGYTEDNLIHASALLRLALSSIARASHGTKDRIGANIEWMREHLSSPLRLHDLAAHASLSIPRYSELFRKRTGFAPIDFLIRQRIQRACQLLDTTQLKVAAVAQAIGYDDPYYFSRLFSKVIGRSPRHYRMVPKG